MSNQVASNLGGLADAVVGAGKAIASMGDQKHSRPKVLVRDAHRSFARA